LGEIFPALSVVVEALEWTNEQTEGDPVDATDLDVVEVDLDP